MSDTQMVLPTDRVVYYAQEVCAVIATERYIAADAVENIFVEYEPLDPVINPFDALEDKIIVREDKELKTNRIWHWEAGDAEGTDRVFDQAAHVVHQYMHIPRIHVASIETCGMVANYNPAMGKMQLYMTTQAPHAIRTVFALGFRITGAEDPGHISRYRRWFWWQGSGISGLRGLRCRQLAARQARKVDRGPQ